MAYPITTSFKQELVKLTQDQIVECYIIDLASVVGYASFNSSSRKIISRDRNGIFPTTRIKVGDEIAVSGSENNNTTFTVSSINERELTVLETPDDEGTVEISISNYLCFAQNDFDIYGWKMVDGEFINLEQIYSAINVRRENISSDLEGVKKGATLRVGVSNVNRIMESFVEERAYLRGCDLYIITSFVKHFPSGVGYSYVGSTPDYLSGIVEKLVIDSSSSNQEFVFFSCKYKLLFKNTLLPGRIMDRDFCSWATYKGIECDPSGIIDEDVYPTCDGTLFSCRVEEILEDMVGFQEFQERLFMYNFEQYLNNPYKDAGRDFSGVDCFGLISLIFKTEKGIDIPDYAENRQLISCSINSDDHFLGSITKHWRIVKQEEFSLFDVHIFFSDSTHSGIYIGGNRFLHVVEDSAVELGRIDIWKKKLVFTMRYIGDAKDHI